MADNPKQAAEAQPAAKGGGIGKMVMYVAMMTVPAILAVGVYMFFIAPKTGGDPGHETAADGAEGNDEHADVDDAVSDVLPNTATEVPFESSYVTTIMSDPTMPASLLIFDVTLVCLNPETAAIIEAKKDHFKALINDLHSFKKREELINDPTIKSAIEKQIVKDCNIKLLQLKNTTVASAAGGGAHGGGEEAADSSSHGEVKLRVLQALHKQFLVQDQP